MLELAQTLSEMAQLVECSGRETRARPVLGGFSLVVDLLCAGFTVRHFDETLQCLEETFRAVKSTRQS